MNQIRDEALREIAENVRLDTDAFTGQPFDHRSVAAYRMTLELAVSFLTRAEALIVAKEKGTYGHETDTRVACDEAAISLTPQGADPRL